MLNLFFRKYAGKFFRKNISERFKVYKFEESQSNKESIRSKDSIEAWELIWKAWTHKIMDAVDYLFVPINTRNLRRRTSAADLKLALRKSSIDKS